MLFGRRQSLGAKPERRRSSLADNAQFLAETLRKSLAESKVKTNRTVSFSAGAAGKDDNDGKETMIQIPGNIHVEEAWISNSSCLLGSKTWKCFTKNHYRTG